MEPAGSHGVHSLDDFQFLCFLFGSVQMGCQNDLPEPNCFAEAPVVNKFGQKYMFLQAIEHINTVKTGPFAEHSNTLWGVSGARSWDKVSSCYYHRTSPKFRCKTAWWKCIKLKYWENFQLCSTFILEVSWLLTRYKDLPRRNLASNCSSLINYKFKHNLHKYK